MKRKICVVVATILVLSSVAIMAFASGGPKTGNGSATVTNTTGTGGSYSFGYTFDSTYYGALSSERPNVATGGANASVTFASNTFTISATSSAGENPWGSWSDKSAQNVSTEATITNNSQSTLIIGYTFSASGGTVAGSDYAVGSGTITLIPGQSIFLTVKTQVTSWSAGSSTATATFKITSCKEVLNYDLKIYPSQFGSYNYSVGSTVTGTLNSGSSVYTTQASASDKITLSVPEVYDAYAEEYYFYGWSVNGSVTSSTVAYSASVTTHTTVFPVFIKKGTVDESGNGPFYVNGKYYVFWREAFIAAGTSYPVVLTKNYTLPATLQENGVVESDGLRIGGNAESVEYIVPANATLLIPFDSSNSLYTNAPGIDESYTTPTVYRTLTLEANVHITVNGALSLSAKQSSTMNGHNGAPSGPVSRIDMKSESSITISDGAFLYAWGFITGKGVVTVKSGGTVYEDFQGADYRGGSATSTVNSSHTNRVFPMSQYYIQNVEAPMTLEAGAREYGYFSVSVTLAGVQSAAIPLIGGDGSGCMFEISSGSITKQYDPATDRLILNIDGKAAIANFNFSLKVVLIGSITLKTEEYVLPINNNISINVKDDSTLNIDQDIALLPGSELYIMSGGECVVGSGKNIYVYDLDEWAVAIPTDDTYYSNYAVDGKIGFCSEYNKFIVPVSYSPTKTGSRSYATLTDASIRIDGTFDADAGAVYTTTGGANIYSTGEGIFYSKAGTSTVTYQMTSKGSDRTGVKYHSIAITPAKLKNENGTTITSGTATYYHAHYDCTACNNNGQCGVWHNATHQESKNVVDPTCTENGYTKYTCVCSHSYTTDIKAFLGHKPGAPATCTTAQTCTVCNTKIVGAKGHAWNWGEWSSATNGQQCTCTCGNDASHTITVLLAYRMDSYIWLNATVSSDVGTLVCNEMTLQSTSGGNYLVQKVLSNHITDSVCVTFQVDEFGKTNKLEIGFLEYAKLLSADTNTTDETVELLASMLMYGEASEDYFGKGEELDGVAITGNDNGTILTAYQENLLNNTAIPERLKTALRACALSGHNADKNLLKPADTNANYGEKGLENGLTISTTGAAFYFDEALRLSVGYRFADGVVVNLDENGNPDGTITFGGTTYTVLQVGLLVQELEDWTMCDVLYAEEGVTAYIAYDNSASLESGRVDEEGNQENHPDVGEGGPDAFVNTLGSSGEINFDLLVKEYNKGFALRTYAVLKDANGTQYVIYGKQYGYGLEAYVKATYGVDTAFDPLLATAWGYAQAAAARYPEVK